MEIPTPTWPRHSSIEGGKGETFKIGERKIKPWRENGLFRPTSKRSQHEVDAAGRNGRSEG